MLGVTYRPGVEWEPGHIRSLVRNIQQWLRNQGVGVVPLIWVGELQRRGAVHYHAAVWLPKGVTIPKPDQRGWWPYGSSRIQWARFAPGYLAKYISKVESKDARFPKGMRLYGVSGVSSEIRDLVRFEKMPAWVKEGGGTLEHELRRAVGAGGIVSRVTGEWRPSPFRAMRARAGWVRLRVVIPHPEPFSAMEHGYEQETPARHADDSWQRGNGRVGIGRRHGGGLLALHGHEPCAPFGAIPSSGARPCEDHSDARYG
jgi:hypothetical protein